MTETSLHRVFGQLSAPRINRQKKHLLIDVVILSVLAVLSCAESWGAIELYGRENLAFLKQILRLPSGIPSHDTINRVFGMINARHFERLFSEWADELKDSGTLERVVAIDGKTACVSRDTFHSKSPVHLVHAWSVENGLCLGQYRTATKNNEITAIPELLDILDIAGSIVTIDAMETQTTITKKIIECKADYILAVKGNQGELREEVETVCNRHRPASDTTETEKGHGRIETCRCQVFGKGLTVDPEVRWRACSRR